VSLWQALALDWPVIRLTLSLCLWTTVILLLLGLPLAAWLAWSESKVKPLVEALIALPLVLPPTVLGFYLLILLGPQGAVGASLERFGLPHLAFSFPGLVIGSVLYSLPFAVQPLHEGLRSIGRAPLDMAATLGAGPIDRFFSVLLPLLRGSLLTAATLVFAHTLGEFGVILMLGGNIPGQTQVLSIAIYDAAEALDYARAHRLSLLMLGSAFVLLALLFALRRRGAAGAG
jgi:molybdate transport system permease protein